jgi:hypothetical protein
MSMSTKSSDKDLADANADPLTGEAGAHPVATGIGAAAMGAAGLAVAAAVAGPIGVAVATAGGALIGGYVGKAVGEVVDPTAEEAFWRDEHPNQAFADQGAAFDDYAPAYRVGYEGYYRFGGDTKSFEEAEKELQTHYETTQPKVPWTRARAASQAAWNRVHRGEAKTSAPVQTGVADAVLSENSQSGALSNAQMPR